jgi:hypothetical protein
MAFLQLTPAEWKDCYRGFVRHASGNPKARVPNKKYPWKDSFILVEGEEQDAPPLLTVEAADVLNSAVAQKHSLHGALGAASSTRDKELMILRVGAGTAWSTCKAAGHKHSCSQLSSYQPPLLLLCVCARLSHGT